MDCKYPTRHFTKLKTIGETMFTIESTLEEMKNDSDWINAFREAEGSGYDYDSKSETLNSVIKVFASSRGENDGDNWIALVQLNDGIFCKMFAGCDYTGWDCQAGGNIEYYPSLEELISKNTLTEDEAKRLNIPWE